MNQGISDIPKYFSKKRNSLSATECFFAILLPSLPNREIGGKILSIWGLAYWQTSKLRDEQTVLKAEVARLQTYAVELTDETGGGVGVWKMENGEYVVALPHGAEPNRSGKNSDGLYIFRYTWLPVSK